VRREVVDCMRLFMKLTREKTSQMSVSGRRKVRREVVDCIMLLMKLAREKTSQVNSVLVKRKRGGGGDIAGSKRTVFIR
jgi:hypothetical protein